MSPHYQKAQLALGAASFVLLLTLTWMVSRSGEPREGRHEIRHTIIVEGEEVVIVTRTHLGEDVGTWLLRHKQALDRARNGE